VPLRLHRAPRADRLAEALAALLADPLPDPFAQELVLVPARGVERWLSQRLSHHLGHGATDDGVCAGVTFRSPRSLIAEVTGLGREGADQDPWAPDALVWPLLAVVDASAGEDWCRTLGAHLGHGRSGEEGELRRGRRYAVARRLARLFASYAAQRPRLLGDWEAGVDSDGTGARIDPDLVWQPELWRRLVAAVGAPSPVVRHAQVLAQLADDASAVDLPERVSLFGHTRIAVTEVELLAALGQHRDVHVWLPHPSDALWGSLTGLSGAVPRREDPSHLAAHHPLLASLGRDLRELERTLLVHQPVVEPAQPVVEPDHQDSLLAWLQSDIAANATVDPGSRQLADDDHSVQVHACHGPARQVEVLREVLLGLLADDETLEPRDILVMCPDIEAYAPLVEAAFGMGDAVAGGHPGQLLQVRLADRALSQTNPLLAVLDKLLDLAGGRAEASAVLDLVAAEPVRRRFGLADNDLETITGWVEKAGVRWAYDEQHRAPYGLDGYVQNTWRFGLDRVLAGVAMSDDAQADGPGWIGTTLPLDDVGSTSIELAGRLAELLDRLQSVTDALSGSHPVDEWLETLREGLDALTAVARGEWQSGEVKRELTSLAGDARRSEGALELRLPDVRALMAERLSGQPTRANFRTGTLTVCTMVPMRSVPHRVVCLLGLDDGVFPRAPAVDGDDVLARTPLTGERDLRSEDRQLLLDAILAARERLVVTYSGANETTGQRRPPAVPLGELLDALDDTVTGGRSRALVRHPLQSFDARNLQSPVPFSFDRAALAGARAAAGTRVQVASLATAVLPARAPADLELASLVAFFRHPVRAFLRDRLGVAQLDEGEEVADGLPVELDNLEQWGVGDRLLADLLRGRTPDQALATEWRRGVLPPGRLGWRLGQRLTGDAAPVAEMVESVTQGRSPRAVDVDVDLGGGRRLRGTVTGLYGDRVVVTTFSRLGPRQWLEAWIPLLALCATHAGRPWSAGAIGRGEKGRYGAPDESVARVAFASVDEAADLLRDLVAMYDAGMCAPLPLPLKTAHAWATRRRPGNDVAVRRDAEFRWLSIKFPGENDDAAHVAVWGSDAALDVLLDDPLPGEERDGENTRLGALATRLWQPMLQRGKR
jgi:exodeoxyribonuclease V gamma subunit